MLSECTKAWVDGANRDFLEWAAPFGYNLKKKDKPVTRDNGLSWTEVFVDNVTQAAYHGFLCGMYNERIKQ